MSRILTVPVSDQTYAAIQTEAATSGVSAAQIATAALERQLRTGTVLTEEQKRLASERFERHFGEVNLGSPTGADNDSIDADPEREYANNHEAKRQPGEHVRGCWVVDLLLGKS